MNILNIAVRASDPVSDSVLKRFSVLPTPAVSDSLLRDPSAEGLVPIAGFGSERVTMVGRALTVRTRPGDNLALHYALELVEPGDVIVVDGGGETRNALLGELIVSYAMSKGVAGFVVDGAIRDSLDLRVLALPVFARGVSHRGPYKSGPGQLHSPISVGGSVVCDGDVVIGDLDGVVFVPRDRAEEIASAAEQVVKSEDLQQAAISRGTWDRSWIATAAQVKIVGMGAGARRQEKE